MQCSLVKIINTKQFLRSIQVRYPTSQDPTSTEQCGWVVMSRWEFEYLGIDWYLLFFNQNALHLFNLLK